MAKKNEAQVANTEVQGEAQIETPAFNYTKALETWKTKSGVIRGLHAEGKSCKEIYGLLKGAAVTNNTGSHPIRYQHVRNVLNTPVKKG